MEWKPRKLTREQLEERRLEAGRLLKEGQLSQSEIARRFGVSRMAVSYWASRYRSSSLKRPQYVPAGRPSKLTPAQKRELKQRLKKSALAAGFPTKRWTLERVAALIKREFGVRYHPNYLPRVLRDLGFGRYAANNTTGDGRRPGWPDDKILETSEACELAGVTRATLSVWRKSGKLKAFDRGGKTGGYRYLAGEMKRMLRARTRTDWQSCLDRNAA